MRKSFKAISSELNKDSPWKDIFDSLAEKESRLKKGVNDSYVDLMGFTTSEIDGYKEQMYKIVQGNIAKDGPLVTLPELEKKMTSVLPETIKAMSNKSTNFQVVLDAFKKGMSPDQMLKDTHVMDGYYNAMTGQGVTGFDPGSFNMAYTPVSMSPNECTSYYSNGGLPAIIIDKKVKGAMINGYNFVCNDEDTGLNEKDRKTLKDYANDLGFDQQIEHTDRDGLGYGGAFMYPVFKRDRPETFDMPVEQLFAEGIVDKDSIDYFVEGDRWNSIMVPNYNIAAKDYLSPDSYMIPLAGVRVNHERMAIVRPILLPYWGALRQLGWGRSDFESYIQSILAYKILIASVPIMAQQMSLLVHIIPLDGIIAENGPAYAQGFAQNNSQLLRAWSFLNPLTINSYGELKAIDRSFSDFDKLNMALRQDVAANSGIPESVLFHTQQSGFSNNIEDSTLKQSETIRNINNAVIPSYKNIIKLLIASCFGANSEQFKKADNVRISFDSPDIISSEERSKMLEKFSSGVNMLVTAGINVHDAVTISNSFMPEIVITEEIMGKLETKNPDPDAKAQNQGGFPPKPGYKPEEGKKMNLSKEGKN